MTKRINRLVLQAIAASLIAVSFNSCSDKNEDSDWTSFETNNAADVYFVPKQFFSKQYEKDCFVISCDNILQWEGSEGVYHNSEIEYAYDSNEKQTQEMFKKYAAYYGDTVAARLHTIPHLFHICVSPLTSINITTNKQLDESHPEGSNINDLLVFEQYFAGVHEYLTLKTETGQPIYKTKIFDQFFDEYHKNHVRYDLNAAPFPMIGNILYIVFKKLPEIHGNFIFTVTLTFADDPITGEKIEVEPITVEMSF